MHPTEPTTSRAPARVPRATYRFQFNQGFTFRDAAELVPYLAELGVSDLYASPYLQARSGSMHGYDIVNHGALNPEIGTEAEHARLSAALREHGMGQLLDIVPNHMGIAGGSNAWWNDVLENGPSSRYAPFFDIDWHPRKPELEGKVLLPVLGAPYGEVLESGELKIGYEDGIFHLDYYETRFPLAPRSTSLILTAALGRLDVGADAPERMELESIVTALRNLPPRHLTDAEHVAERRREKVVTQRRLSALCAASPRVREALDRAVDHFNGTRDDPSSFDPLDELLHDQAYRLAFWRVAAEEINYRRFFDINDLAGVRVEVPRVFDETHRLVLRLVREGKVTGLRIDHPDGLYDPRGYLRDLQVETAGLEAEHPFYLLVEKILTGDEELPESWPVAGTVGYEFLNRINGLFVAAENEAAMDGIYRRFARMRAEFDDLAYASKKLILSTSLVSELTVLATLLSRMSERNRRSRDFTFGSLREALREVTASFPIYRTYIDAEAGRVTERDREYVEQAIRLAKRRNPTTSGLVFDYIRDVLLLRWPEALDRHDREEHALFVMKFQQLTGPVMAKGVEDTVFYVFNRLVSLNEVGGEPDHFGTSPEALHRFSSRRAEKWPHAMSTSSTHDTKRSEDVRARINVLSEIPYLWEEHVNRWAAMNARHRREEEGLPVPGPNDEYLLYQTLVGAWPLEDRDGAAHAELVERIQRYMEKATREAKVHTSWINPNEAYDRGLREFISDILRDPGNEFASDLGDFSRTVARMGMLNSLSQTLLKLVTPGVPDIYQGQELWDFSLVDPDNRRPVDFALRRRLLRELGERLEARDRAGVARELVERWEDGAIKLYLTREALRLRAARPELFSEGAYLPLEPGGVRPGHLFAFARTRGPDAVIAAVPRLVATLTRDRGFTLPDASAWEGSRIEVPPALEGRYRNVLTGEEIRVEEHDGATGIAADALFASFPVALLATE